MAELILVASDDTNPNGYRKHDIIEAHSNRSILCSHTEQICSVLNNGNTIEGLRAANGLSRHFQQAVYQYRFDRVNKTTIERTTIATGKIDVIGGTPRMIDGRLQHMDVEQYIKRRIIHNRHRIFGLAGSEFWFGGRTDASLAKLAVVWNEIEDKTSLLKANHMRSNFNGRVLRKYLVIASTDFSDMRRDILTEPDIDDTDPDDLITLPPPSLGTRLSMSKTISSAKRKHTIDWENDLGISGRTLDDIRDSSKEVAIRYDIERDEGTITITKTKTRP